MAVINLVDVRAADLLLHDYLCTWLLAKRSLLEGR